MTHWIISIVILVSAAAVAIRCGWQTGVWQAMFTVAYLCGAWMERLEYGRYRVNPVCAGCVHLRCELGVIPPKKACKRKGCSG